MLMLKWFAVFFATVLAGLLFGHVQSAIHYSRLHVTTGVGVAKAETLRMLTSPLWWAAVILSAALIGWLLRLWRPSF